MQSLASFVIIGLLQSLLFRVYGHHQTDSHNILEESSPFPSDFLFGTASSAYQYEGAFLTDGKSLNNWDVFTHEHPEEILDKNNGDRAVDQYHLFMEDIQLMTFLGVNTYRFSISWSRILPKGRFGGINYSGIKYYNMLIDALISRGIKPFVTLNHVDYPQELENRFFGWLSPKMQNEFGYLADICFKHFGDRVKYWTTINEPNQQIILGYLTGRFPPSRCSSPYGYCSQGNSETEPFIAAHNTILAHAKASYFIQDCLVSACDTGKGAFKAEGFALKLNRKGNVTIGELTDVSWLHNDPQGFRKMLNYLKDRYPNVPMFITENGYGDLEKPETTLKELLNDTKRIQYMSGYLEALLAAMRDGANVKGYFVWSLLDNFEWLYGYKLRFGLYHVDFTNLKRTPKQSASWYKNFIQQHVNTRDLIDKQ